MKSKQAEFLVYNLKQHVTQASAYTILGEILGLESRKVEELFKNEDDLMSHLQSAPPLDTSAMELLHGHMRDCPWYEGHSFPPPQWPPFSKEPLDFHGHPLVWDDQFGFRAEVAPGLTVRVGKPAWDEDGVWKWYIHATEALIPCEGRRSSYATPTGEALGTYDTPSMALAALVAYAEATHLLIVPPVLPLDERFTRFEHLGR